MEKSLNSTTHILDGKLTASNIRKEIAAEVADRKSKGLKVPHLAAVLIGNDGGSETYVSYKVKDCAEVGFGSTLIRRPDSISESELLSLVEGLNNNDAIDGFIIQLPLPAHIDAQRIITAINPDKDVDGFHPTNLGRMALDLPGFLPATPSGIIELLKRNGISTVGKHCVIVGRSNIVGSPLSILLSRNKSDANATVTLCHSRTKDVASLTRQADILVCALGKPGFITADMVKDGAVVVDVGTTRVLDDSRASGFALKGDVRYEEVFAKASYITPVPGGVGPMTRVALLLNTLRAANLR